MIKIGTPVPAAILAELRQKTNAEPPPPGMAWSVVWGPNGRRTDLDALVPIQPHTPPAGEGAQSMVLVYPLAQREWLAANLPDDLAVPGTIDRLTAYIGTPEREA